MAEPSPRHPAWTPFADAWHFVENMIAPAGHLVVTLLGAFLTVVGLILTITVYAAPLGVAVLLVGVVLFVRNVYGRHDAPGSRHKHAA